MTTTVQGSRPTDRATRRWKLLGLGSMAVPVVLISVFAIAEGVGLEPGWWGHLIQLGLVVLVVGLAWMRPRIGGPALLTVDADTPRRVQRGGLR